MSVLLPRLAAATVGTAVALAVLGAPSAALAAPGNPAPAAAASAAAAAPAAPAADQGRARAGEARPEAVPAGSSAGAVAGRSAATAPRVTNPAAERRPAATGQARASEAQSGPRGSSAQGQQKAAEVRRSRGDKPATAEKSAKPAKTDKAAKTDKPAAGTVATKAAGTDADTAKGGDPRGNNGTFKVDGPVLDTSHGNEPQVDCQFRLNFFGYDAGQLANIVFTPVAPTPGASTTVSGRQLISSDAAKGGLYNGSYPVTGTWTAADLGLDPTVRQHVKVSVESLNADGSDVPGGAKHKVFWLHPCAAAAPAAADAPSALAPAVLPEVVGTRSISAAPAAPPVVGLPAAQPATRVLSAPVMGPQAQVLGAAVSAVRAQAAAPATLVAAPGADRAVAAPAGAAPAGAAPATLPFTGSPQLLALLVGGLIALLGGAGLVAAARTSA